jgi:hypothetical protein
VNCILVSVNQKKNTTRGPIKYGLVPGHLNSVNIGLMFLTDKGGNMRKIYVEPGESLEIRVVDDPLSPKTSKEWGKQLRPDSIIIKIINGHHIQIHQAALTISQTDIFTGKIKLYR